MCENKEMERISFVILISTLMLASLSIVPAHAAEHPTIIAASVTSATEIVLTYSENIDVSTTDGAGFALSVGQVTANTDPGGSDDTITLTVSGITTAVPLTITYTALLGSVTDTESNPAADQTFTGTTDDAPPTVLSIVTNDTSAINIVLSEDVTINGAAPEDFALSGTISTDPAVTGITAVTNNTVALALDDTLDSNDVILLAYTKTTGSIDDIPASPPFVGSFSVSSQDTFPQGLAFSADGTKMFVLGDFGNDINEYTLTTAFDVSTATFVDSFSVALQDGFLQGLAFSDNGTKMFVLGDSGDDINEYTLTTAFDVSTASFVDSFSVASQEDEPQGLAFSNDGTKMFVVGNSGDDINEYTLTTAFDVSTASFVDSFSVSSQDTSPWGLAFSNDGTKMFVVGNSGDDINEYTLTTAFDVSTASFVDSFSVSSQDTFPRGLAFSNDGTKMFVVGASSDAVHQYALSDPFTLYPQPNSLASFDARPVANNVMPPPAIIASSLTSATSITLTYSEDIDVATTDGQGFSLSIGQVTGNTNPGGSGNTLTLTVSGITNTSDTPAITYTASLGTVTDTESNPAADQTFDRTTDDAPPTVSSIATAGTSTVDVILSEDVIYNLAAPEDFVLYVQSGNTLTSMTIGEITAVADTLTLDLDATLASDDVINLEYNKATGSIDDILAPPSFVGSFSQQPQNSSFRDLAFSADGYRMFTLDGNNDAVYQYALAAPFDVSTASSSVTSFSVAPKETVPRNLAFSADGTKMFVTGSSGDGNIHQYALTAPFDISTVTFVGSFSPSSQDTFLGGLAFSNDGTKMFVAGRDNNVVFQYTLTTPFDISTATFADFFLIGLSTTAPQDLAFSGDGTRMFVIDNDNIAYQYALAAPFDISTVTFVGSFPVGSPNVFQIGLAFSGDGTRMFLLDNTNSAVREYALSDPFTLFPQPNSLASFAATSVENNISSDTVPPTITAASVTSATSITLTYSENIDVSTTDGEGFALSTGQVTANTNPDNSDDTITLTVSGITTSDRPDVIYAASDGTVTDSASNPAASQTFDRTTDDAPPTVSSIATSSMSAIDVVLSEDVTINDAAPEDFVLSSTISTDPTVTGITALADTVTLSLDDTLAHNDVISLAYTRNTGSIDDIPASPPFVGSFSVASQDPFPRGLAFSADGTKMFVLGDSGDDINEYTLTTPFDVSTASYVDSFPVGLQELLPRGLAFSGNGTKMFVTGIISKAVNEYTLTAPFDVSTASFVDSFPVSSQDEDPQGLAFSNDGTKMFVVGNSGDDINEYTLTAPFDVSTASFVDSFPVSSQDTAPQGLAFSNDGTKMFVVGDSGDDINEYTLTAPFDVSTASSVDSFSVSSQDTSPRGLAFSNDGTKMFVVGDSSAAVHQYALPDPFTLYPQPNSLASFDARQVANNIMPPTPTIAAAVVLSDTGIILTYDRNIDVTTTDGRGFTLSGGGTVTANTDPAGTGSVMLLTGSGIQGPGVPVITYTDAAGTVANSTEPFVQAADQTFTGATKLPNRPEITAAAVTSDTEIVLTYSENVYANHLNGQGFSLSDGGTVHANTNPAGSDNTIMLTVSGITGTSSTPDITYDGTAGNVYNVAINAAKDQTFGGTTDGAPPIVSSIATSGTFTINVGLSEDVTISNATPEDFVLSGTISTDPAVTSISPINTDGIALHLDAALAHGDDIRLAYTRATGYIDDLSAADTSHTDSFQTQYALTRGITFSDDGTRMFILNTHTDFVSQYTLAAPFDMSDATLTTSFPIGPQDDAPYDLAFSDDGTGMFVLGDETDTVYKYALPKPFDLSTGSASATLTSFPVPPLDSASNLRGLTFSDNGHRMFVLSDDAKSLINEYVLAAPFDLSTYGVGNSYQVPSIIADPADLAFSPDGKTMFVVGSGNDAVYQYSLAVPFDLSTATLLGGSFSISSQEPIPTGLTFSNDGKKMFVVGNANDHFVYEYSLSNPFTLFPGPNSLASFAATSVTNSIPPPDTTPPTIIAAAVTSLTEILLTYDEDIGVTTTDGTGFALSVGSVTANTDPDHSGNTLTLTVTGITASDTPDVIYTESDGTVTDIVSNQAEDQTFTGTTPLVDTIPPEITTAVVISDTQILLTYSEDIDVDYTDGQGFSLSTGQVTANSDPEGSGDTITLVVSGIPALSDGTHPDIIYSASDGNTVADTASNQAADQTFDGTTRLADTVPPEITAAVVTSLTEIVLTYSEDIIVGNTNGQGFALSTGEGGEGEGEVGEGEEGEGGEGGTVTANTVSDGTDNTITLTVSGITGTSDTPNIIFSSPPGVVADTALNPAQTQTFVGTVDGVPPVVSSIDTAGTTTIDVTLSENIAYNLAAPEDFVLSGDISTNPAVTAISVVADTVTLSLDDNLDHDDDINITYTRTAGSIDDVSAPLPPPLSMGSFSVGTQDKNPRGLAFSADGTKMFVAGYNGHRVNEYSLAVPFDISSNAVYIDRFSVVTPEGIIFQPQGLTFSANGTGMFVVDSADDAVRQYALDVPFDLSTASYDSSFTVASQDTDPRDVAVSADGTMMFVTGNRNDAVYAYVLPDPFDVSTVDPVGSFSLPSQNSSPSGLTFSADGTRMFVVNDGSNNDAVFQYVLAAPFDVSDVTFVSSFSVRLQDSSPWGLTFSDDGTTMFVVGDSGSDVNQYALSEPFTLLPQPNSLASFAATSVTNDIRAPLPPSDGTVDPHADTALLTVSSINTAGISAIDVVLSKSVTIRGAAPEDFALSGDISTDPAITAITALANTVTLALDDTLDSDDVISLTYAKTTGSIDDIPAPPSPVHSFSVSPQTSSPEGLAFSDDGKTMFVVDSANDAVNQYTLSAPFDVSTNQRVSSFSVESQDEEPRGIAFSNDGMTMFVTGRDNDSVYQYALTVPFDVTTAVSADSFSVSSQNTRPRGITFSNDGYRMFVMGFESNTVNQYALTTSFDVSDGVTFDTSFSVSSQDSSVSGLAFSNDGTRMFVTGSNFDSVYQYALVAPFDVSNVTGTSNVSHVDRFSVTSEDSSPQGIAFSNDGTTMFVVGDSADAVHQYALSEPFALSVRLNSLASFEVFPVKNNILPGPTITAAAMASATQLVLTYDKNIRVNTTDGTGFALSDGLVTANTNPAGSNNIMTLTVSGIAASDTPAITYTALLGTVTDNASNQAEGQTFAGTTAGITPTVSSLNTVDTSIIEVVLSENVTVNGAAPGDFALSGDISTDPVVTGIINITADTLLLTLDDTLDGNDVISLAYDKTTGSIDDIPAPPSLVHSFSVSSQSNSPEGLAFSADGTTMFVVDSDNDAVNQYALAAPFDVSNATFADSFSVGTQDEEPRGIAFSNDGMMMFITGHDNVSVYQYALTTPFDVSNATTTTLVASNAVPFSDRFSDASRHPHPSGITFSNDGYRMFVIDFTFSTVNQYTLTTPFDVSDGVTFDTYFSVNSRISGPIGLAFSNDGTRMFITGGSFDSVYQYTLAAAFDVSNVAGTSDVTYTDHRLSVTSGRSAPQGIAFSNDGTTMLVVADRLDAVYQYALSEPFALSPPLLPDSLASFAAAPVTNNVAPPTIIASSLISATELVLTYSENIGVNTINGAGFTLLLSDGQVTANSDPNNLSNTITLTISGITGITGTSDTPAITYTASDGTVTGTASNQAAPDQTFVDTTAGTTLTVSSINTAGTTTIDVVLSEDATINSAVPEDFALSGTISTDPVVTGITVLANTVTLALDDTLDSNDVIRLAYTKTTGSIDDIPLPPFDRFFSFPTDSQDRTPTGLAFSDDGTRMFVVGDRSDKVYQYALTVPFDMSTASYDGKSFSVSSQDSFTPGLTFSNDGTRMFATGDDGNDVNQYALTDPFDVSDVTFAGSFPTDSQDNSTRGLAFSNDGTAMFVVGDDNDAVYQYTLTAPFDISTASYDDKSFSVSSQDTFPFGLAFSADGKTMFVVGSGNDAVYQYALPTPFDISTVNYDRSFPISSQSLDLTGLAFSADGTRMFVASNVNDSIYQYALSKPFTLSPQPDSLASFAAILVTNDIPPSPDDIDPPADTIPPTITAAAVTSLTEIVLTYSENIGVATTNGEGFSLSTGQVTANSDPAGSGNTITLTVSGITTADAPAITYTAPPGTVTDSASNPAADQTFADTTDNAPPTVSSIATAGTSAIDVVLSENVTINGAAPEDFALSGTISTDPTVTEITVLADTVTLFLDDTLDHDDVISLAYTKATGSIDDRPPTTTFVTSFSVASQADLPSGLAFSNDGTKMFVVGIFRDVVNEYTLSTAFDVSTASFVDFFLVSQDTAPLGLAFSADGTKMFVIGLSSEAVFEYTLTAPFDISTASFVDSFSVASQDIFPEGLAFSDDGTRMFVVGSDNDAVYEYTLSTAFDVSTSVFDSSFPVASQDTSPFGLAFSADGKKMFVVGGQGKDVNEYVLSTPFDVSTAAFAGSSVSRQDTNPSGLAFSGDGTKMFVLDEVSLSVNEYALSDPFTLYPQPNSLASFEAAPVTNNILPGPTIIASSMTSATSITLTYSENIDVEAVDGEGFTLSTGQVTANTIPAGSGSNTITLTVSGITNTSDTPDVTYTAAPDGTVVGDTSNAAAADQIFRSTVDDSPPTVSSVATNGTSAIDIILSENVTINGVAPEDFVLSGDISVNPAVTGITVVANNTVTLSLGNALDGNDVILLAYNKTTGSIDDSSAVPTTFVDSFSVTSEDAVPQGLAFSGDGYRMFVAGDYDDSIYQYALTAPFDVSTTTFVGSFSVFSQGSVPQGLAFSNDGKTMFFVGDLINSVYQYTLATAFDISTAAFVDSFSVSSQDTSPQDLAFSGDGTKMFVVGDNNNSVYQYSLTTPFDISTASYDDRSFSVSSQDRFPSGLAFSGDGTTMFVAGGGSNAIYQYALATAFDVSTASSLDSPPFSVSQGGSLPFGLAFSGDGTRMFVVGSEDGDVNEYALSKPFALYPQPNSLAGFEAIPVTNNIPPDTVPPTIIAAAMTSATEIVLTYSENIDVTTTNGTGFALSTGQVSANTDPDNSGNTITLTVSGITDTSDTPNVTYTESDGTVTDTSSNPAANQIFRSTVDDAPPTVSSIETSSTSTIDIVLSENVTINLAAPEDFALSGTISTDPTVTGITILADTVTLTLDNTLDGNDVISLAYDKATGSIDDISAVPTAFVDSFSVASEISTPSGLAFSNDGTRMFVVGNDIRHVHQYALIAPFNVLTASYVDRFLVYSQDASPRDLAFSNDGKTMFVVGSDNDAVYEYALTAAFDVLTASFVDAFSVSSEGTSSTRHNLLQRRNKDVRCRSH